MEIQIPVQSVVLLLCLVVEVEIVLVLVNVGAIIVATVKRFGDWCGVVFGCVMERIQFYHICGHEICPFDHLWSNVRQEGVGRPSSE